MNQKKRLNLFVASHPKISHHILSSLATEIEQYKKPCRPPSPPVLFFIRPLKTKTSRTPAPETQSDTLHRTKETPTPPRAGVLPHSTRQKQTNTRGSTSPHTSAPPDPAPAQTKNLPHSRLHSAGTAAADGGRTR